MPSKNNYLFFLLLVFVFLLTSCATADFTGISSSMIRGNYTQARLELENQKERLYTENDKVLYNLDAGVLSHYSGDWEQSNVNFSAAENLIEQYYSKSISQGVSSYFMNDMVVDYAGEDYEDIYTNFFMALNYIHLGKIDDAMVEIRRFDNKQKLLATKYTDQLSYASDELGSSYSDVSIQFQNSAAARYLSMLLYRANGQSDSAEVDRKLLLRAFEEQPSLYTFNVPSCVNEELEVPRGKARLNFVCFTGQAPTKVEDVSRIYLGDGIYCKIALPLMVDLGSSVKSISVDVYDSSGNAVEIPEFMDDERIVEVAVENAEAERKMTASERAKALVAEAMTEEESDSDNSSRSSAARARAQAMGISAEESSSGKDENLKKWTPKASAEDSQKGASKESAENLKKWTPKSSAAEDSAEISVSDMELVNNLALEKIESIENIALDTFIQHSSVIYSRAMIRAIGKTATTGVLNFVSEFSDDETVSSVFSVLSFASQVTNEVTEQADLRTSRFFPANIYVGGITLDPGVYTVVVTFRGSSGQVLESSTYESVNVSSKSINLVEAICPR